MAYGLGKVVNEYARAVADIDAPKAVWAAIAMSFAMRIAGDGREGREILMEEWQALHDNGIVPQKPRRKRARHG